MVAVVATEEEVIVVGAVVTTEAGGEARSHRVAIAQVATCKIEARYQSAVAHQASREADHLQSRLAYTCKSNSHGSSEVCRTNLTNIDTATDRSRIFQTPRSRSSKTIGLQ